MTPPAKDAARYIRASPQLSPLCRLSNRTQAENVIDEVAKDEDFNFIPTWTGADTGETTRSWTLVDGDAMTSPNSVHSLPTDTSATCSYLLNTSTMNNLQELAQPDARLGPMTFELLMPMSEPISVDWYPDEYRYVLRTKHRDAVLRGQVELIQRRLQSASVGDVPISLDIAEGYDNNADSSSDEP